MGADRTGDQPEEGNIEITLDPATGRKSISNRRKYGGTLEEIARHYRADLERDGRLTTAEIEEAVDGLRYRLNPEILNEAIRKKWACGT